MYDSSKEKLTQRNNRKSVDAIAEEFETEVKSTGHVSIIAQTQQKKLPYSLLNSVTYNCDYTQLLFIN